MKEWWKIQLSLVFKADKSRTKLGRKCWFLLHDILEWMRRPLLCKIGWHQFSWNTFSWKSGREGEIYFSCYKCRSVGFFLPIDDLPLEQQKLKLEFMSKI